eukprot:gnl/MRDRNA2_/MRDRNA2_154963_c0_seq1.p1 gnl/MRDRNA2_/MRDRNA2_154963_c0~~gnl/MRDRNA2_/MRDRNA2_154963_c0_seq1.p1  ORF type:complete len:323 (+),score=52.28 gnl/MRDRNA2_/MRDRNA2_154963_c0_seq1:3-971(+)
MDGVDTWMDQSGHAARVRADTEAIKEHMVKDFHPTLDAICGAVSGNDSVCDVQKDYLREFSPVERLVRIELAAAYRWMAKMGWSDTINNHISARIPNTDNFLLNPYGVGYDEMTASGLVRIDLHGNVIHPGYASQEYARGFVNKAGFILHSAVHEARHDLNCLVHGHDENVVAVAASPKGLLPVGQAYYSMGEITYHDYEGLAVSPSERQTICRDMGASSKVMFLRNHGYLVGGESIGECMILTYYLHKACNMQVKAAACAVVNNSEIVLPSQEVVEVAKRQTTEFDTEDGEGEASRKSNVFLKQWIYHLRSLVKEDPSFIC